MPSMNWTDLEQTGCFQSSNTSADPSIPNEPKKIEKREKEG